jgi:lipid-A-disaccharide synthase-like uncharacterized protein
MSPADGATLHQWAAKLLDPLEWLGFGAQLCFTARFVYQWWKSEKAGVVVLPLTFWYLSIAGALLTILYCIYHGALALIIAQLIALVFYTRNLVIAGRKKSPPG